MNPKTFLKAALLSVLGLALAGAVTRTQAQTIITNTYIDSFDNNGNTDLYTSWWNYWYNFPGNNLAVTNDPSMDAGGDPNSGSMMVVTGYGGYTQNLFFGTFAEKPNDRYNFGVRANLLLYSNISFDIRVAPGTPPDKDGSFGNIGVGIINHGYGYQEFGRPKIPASAISNWVHIVVPIDKTQDNITDAPGICFDINNFTDGYPAFVETNWIDNVAANAPPAPPPPPPTLSAPTPVVTGLNCIATVPGDSGRFNRYHLCTVGSSGYTFYGQDSVTYSWTIKEFPPTNGGSWQSHVFLVTGAPGQYDQAADYNLANCIFLTVQQNNNGTAIFNFRYKTNEPGGNGMLFNTNAPTFANSQPTYTTNSQGDIIGTNAPVNSNFWPVMPACALTNPVGAVGTWSITFAQSTNVTMRGPGGYSTNFVFDPAGAALFTDPLSVCVGAQPNNTVGGQDVVLSHFSIAGSAATIDDQFDTDTNLDTSTWKNLSNDTNGCVLLGPGTAYQIGWTLPDQGYSLLGAAKLSGKSNSWSPISVGTIQDVGKRTVFLNNTNLPGGNSAYFSLVKRAYSKLALVLPGQTFVSGTGVTGTPDMETQGNYFDMTVIATDANNFAVSGVIDQVAITSDDPGFIPPLNAGLQNGTHTFQVQFGSASTGSTNGLWTITATDQVNTAITGNSSGVTVQ